MGPQEIFGLSRLKIPMTLIVIGICNDVCGWCGSSCCPGPRCWPAGRFQPSNIRAESSQIDRCLFTRSLWTRTTGNCSPARDERDLGLVLAKASGFPSSSQFPQTSAERECGNERFYRIFGGNSPALALLVASREECGGALTIGGAALHLIGNMK